MLCRVRGVTESGLTRGGWEGREGVDHEEQARDVCWTYAAPREKS